MIESRPCVSCSDVDRLVPSSSNVLSQYNPGNLSDVCNFDQFLEQSRKSSSYEKGVNAESCAINILLKNGYTLLKRRYRTPYGEIDAILKNENSLIALEVKQRRTMAESAESISRRQQLRISKSFLFFVSGLEEKFDFYRINVMFFDSAGHMNYIENAFYLEDDEA